MSLFLAGLLLTACSARQRCLDSGGRWFEGPASVAPGDQRGSCLQAFPDADRPCRDGSECASGLCLCPPRPEGSEAAAGASGDAPIASPEVAGTCAAYPPASGSGWHCLVVKGKALEQGMIVD